jgi:hypothetical protein
MKNTHITPPWSMPSHQDFFYNPFDGPFEARRAIENPLNSKQVAAL